MIHVWRDPFLCVMWLVSMWHMRHGCLVRHDTGWRRLRGSPTLQIIFHKRAIKYRSLLQEMTYKDKGSYESSPPCTWDLTDDTCGTWLISCVTWLISTWHMRHGCLVRHDRWDFADDTCVTWLISMWNITQKMWLIVMCDVTRFYVKHDTSNVTHFYVWRDSFLCVTWLISMRNMTHECLMRLSMQTVT